MRPVEAPEARELAARMRYWRLAAGLTVTEASKAVGVVTQSLSGWERSEHMPHPWRLGPIASALRIPVAQLLTDELVLAEVRVSPETLAAVKANPAEARAVAERIASNLEPLLIAEATRPPVDVRPGARPKRRRTRAEVLAGVEAAKQARARRRGNTGRIDS